MNREVTVSTSSQGLPGAPDRLFRRKILPVMIASCFACGPVYANPTGPTVVNGQVNIVNNGNTLTITNSPGAIINWS
ncbi:MAG TPA: hypothetical protein VF472_00220, partial [Burkholderiaceae bacterium]